MRRLCQRKWGVMKLLYNSSRTPSETRPMMISIGRRRCGSIPIIKFKHSRRVETLLAHVQRGLHNPGVVSHQIKLTRLVFAVKNTLRSVAWMPAVEGGKTQNKNICNCGREGSICTSLKNLTYLFDSGRLHQIDS